VLTFFGIVIGVLTVAAPIVIAWRQRVVQLHDRDAERETHRLAELEREEHRAKIARREHWQPEYDAIRHHLDCGETLAYRVLRFGPYSMSELETLDIPTFLLNYEILAARGVEGLQDQLLAIASRVDDLVQNAVPGYGAPVIADGQYKALDGALRTPMRLAVLQDRAARDLAELIKTARQVLRAEWGD
jgi:hypothetical protein